MSKALKGIGIINKLTEMHEFFHQVPTVWENATKPIVWGKSGKLILIPLCMGAFFPLDSHPMVYFIIWEMHGFPHQFSLVQENATKPILWGEPGKMVLLIFSLYGCIFPTRSPFYGILYHMGNACAFLSISNNMGKDSQTHCIGKAWGIDSC